MGEAVNKTVEALNSAFKADPNAMHALMCNRVPCNQALADDPYIPVDTTPVLGDTHFQIGALGLLNGILEANGLPKVGMKFSDEVDHKGRAKFVGFCEYVPITEDQAKAYAIVKALQEMDESVVNAQPHDAMHASAPSDHKCADCQIDGEPCLDCYSAWWHKKHPNAQQV